MAGTATGKNDLAHHLDTPGCVDYLSKVKKRQCFSHSRFSYGREMILRFLKAHFLY